MRAAWVTAVLAATSVAGWLALKTIFECRGELTGLFYTGSKARMPPQLGPNHTYRVDDARGYDAQYYHLIAHDPLIRRGFFHYVDNPRLRWRRIAVPGLATLLSAGSDRYVDYAYLAIQLVFVLLGVFWLSWYAQTVGDHPAWGLAFLSFPAVAVSVDRMTVDLALAALAVGLFLYGTGARAGRRSRWPVYAILLAAPLVRETGMLLLIAWCLYSLLQRDWRGALLGAGCGLPTLIWWTYVCSRTPADGTSWLSKYPFSGLIERTLHGAGAPVSTLWLRAAAISEDLALAGIWLALLAALYLAWRRRWGLIELTAILFAAFAGTLGKGDIWADTYAAGRTMSPLLMTLALIALRDHRRVFALPLLLVLPRLALQYEVHIKAIVRGISFAVAGHESA